MKEHHLPSILPLPENILTVSPKYFVFMVLCFINYCKFTANLTRFFISIKKHTSNTNAKINQNNKKRLLKKSAGHKKRAVINVLKETKP